MKPWQDELNFPGLSRREYYDVQDQQIMRMRTILGSIKFIHLGFSPNSTTNTFMQPMLEILVSQIIGKQNNGKIVGTKRW